MAEQFINVKVNSSQAKKQFDDLSESIQLQKEFLAELNLNITKSESSLKNLTFTQQQFRKEAIARDKQVFKVESAALKDLITKQEGLKKVIKQNTGARKSGTIQAIKFNETLLKNEDISQGLSQVTGGLFRQVQGLGRLFLSVGKSIKGATLALTSFQRILLATFVGAVLVAIGLVVANFEKIKNFITGTNPELEKLERQTAKLVETTKSELTLLEKQKELLKLQGKETEHINKLLIQKFQLQKENLLLLLQELETQLKIEKEEAKRVTVFEGLKIAASRFIPFLNTSEQIGKAISSENEKTLELTGKIQETREKILDLDLNIAKINKEETSEEEKQLDIISKQNDKKFDELNAFLKKKETLEQVFFDSFLTQQQLEENAVRDKYFNLINQAKQFNEDTSILEKSQQVEIQEIRKKFDDQVIEDEKRRLKELDNIEKEKRSIREKTFNTAVQLAGEESRLGKAILVAKTILAAKENLIEVKKTLLKAQQASTQATVEGVKSSSAISQGAAETAKVGFPLNIPLLIAYAAQAVGIISAVKSAVSKTKQVASTAGANVGGGGTNIEAPSIQSAAPSFNIIGSAPENQLAQTISETTGKPVKAFVVAGDVTTAQSFDRNIIQESSLG